MGVCWGRRTINKKCMRARILDNSLLDVHNHPSLCDTHTALSLDISSFFTPFIYFRFVFVRPCISLTLPLYCHNDGIPDIDAMTTAAENT